MESGSSPTRVRAHPELLDDLVGAGEQRLRHGEPERLGSFQIDDQRKFGRLLNRKVGRTGTFEDAVAIARSRPPPRHSG